MAVTWADLEVGKIVRYEHLSRAKRLAGQPLTVRRGRLVWVTKPAPGFHGQITVEVLNKDGSVNAGLGRIPTFIERIVLVEEASR
jgi:hypothetical protein